MSSTDKAVALSRRRNTDDNFITALRTFVTRASEDKAECQLARPAREEWMADYWNDLPVGSGWLTTGTICPWGVDGRLLERSARGEWMAARLWRVDDRLPERTVFVFRPLRWQCYLCAILKLSYFFVLIDICIYIYDRNKTDPPPLLPFPSAADDTVLKGIPNK